MLTRMPDDISMPIWRPSNEVLLTNQDHQWINDFNFEDPLWDSVLSGDVLGSWSELEHNIS